MGNWYEDNIEDPIKDANEWLMEDVVAPLLGDDIMDIVHYRPTDLLDDLREPGRLAEELAEKAAELERLSTEESVRIMEEENERTVSTARARAGASGLSGASTEMYIASLEETGQQDVEWLKTVGASNYENRLTEGRLAQVQAQSNMWGMGASVVSTVTGLFS